MPDRHQPDATHLLQRMQNGDDTAATELLTVLYDELHRVAAALMQNERPGHTLQPTALVSEAFVRLVRTEDQAWENRVHFLRVAAHAMRNALIDHARARVAQRRGGGEWRRVTLAEDLAESGHDANSLLAVDESLEKLAAFDPQLAALVEMRFFGGLNGREIGAALSMSERSVQRNWRTARAWLSQDLNPADDRGTSDGT